VVSGEAKGSPQAGLGVSVCDAASGAWRRLTLLVLERAHADLERALLHRAHSLLEVGHLLRLHDRRVDVLGAQAGRRARPVEELAQLGRGRTLLSQLLDEGLR
jgi:hypothetical protein